MHENLQDLLTMFKIASQMTGLGQVLREGMLDKSLTVSH